MRRFSPISLACLFLAVAIVGVTVLAARGPRCARVGNTGLVAAIESNFLHLRLIRTQGTLRDLWLSRGGRGGSLGYLIVSWEIEGFDGSVGLTGYRPDAWRLFGYGYPHRDSGGFGYRYIEAEPPLWCVGLIVLGLGYAAYRTGPGRKARRAAAFEVVPGRPNEGDRSEEPSRVL